jgi:asparagine synthase (glutamine-hydrolysing)
MGSAAPAHAISSVHRPAACIAIGHRRLAIVDLSANAHQPMSYAGGRYWITYNGEIYNHVELRHELAALGHEFRSASDTEVILAAYAQWGRECLSRLNGMFAFVLIDRSAKTLFAARDRFGVKPLYYWIAPDGFVAFASEIKQFSSLPGWRAKINPQRAYDFLNWSLLDHTDETMFDGVFQLRGGESTELEIDSSRRVCVQRRLPCTRWYELCPTTFAGNFEQASTQLLALLTDSVTMRMRADVPIGSCLSGGLDSSSIVCIMNKILARYGGSERQRTFSSCSPIARFDEREFIEAVVAETGVGAAFVYPQASDMFANLDSLTWQQDEPFGSTSIYAQWCVFGLAAQNKVKVMLDGQGADEQLGGYHPYLGLRLATLARSGNLHQLAHEVRALQRLHDYGIGWSAKQILNHSLPEWVRQPLRLLARKPSVMRPAWLDLRALVAEPADPFLGADGRKPESVAALSYAQLTRTNLQMLLHWEDRSSMAHSVEARVPFLDYRLVEFVMGLPESYKIAGGITKRVLRQATLELLPEKVRQRMDKLGFVTAEEVWLKYDTPTMFLESLDFAIAASQGILRPQIKKILERIQSGDRAFDHLVWRAISFGRWMGRFSVSL